MKKSGFVLMLFAAMVMMFTFSGKTYADEWALAYKHTSTGTQISGSLSGLMNAVSSGADIRVITHAPAGDVGWDIKDARVDTSGNYVASRSLTKVKNSSDNDLYEGAHIKYTTGAVKYLYESNNDYSNHTDYYSLSWYVNETDWDLAFKHDDSGSTVSGSRSALETAIEAGADVKVVVHYSDGDHSFRLDNARVYDSQNYVRGLAFTKVNSSGDDDLYQSSIEFKTTGEIVYRYEANNDYSKSSDYESISWYVHE